ncbi:MAG: endonuclease/exonuclease/phosphatase family protein [Flavobacteriaceae bacterium]|nr:endonuclease/exonuclease/phosphatase family protein [Flavobacteriaceae bacterium]
MKNIGISFAIIFMFTLSIQCQVVKIMTYNIRMDNPDDGENAWPNRKENLTNQILYYGADVIGIQEGLEHQVHYLDANLESFKRVGVGRADVKESGMGEYSAIYYNSKKYKKLKSGTFWLSKSPDTPSRGWDASLNRICTFILLKSKVSDAEFWVFNTHFDHKGIEARKKSAALIIQKITAINKDKFPVFLMGDFNLQPTDAPIQLLAEQLNDSKKISQLAPYGPVGTFNGFDILKKTDQRIDYIFTSKKNISIQKYAVLADVNNQKYPSDHFPVMVEATLK